jgi:hypothetical protein
MKVYFGLAIFISLLVIIGCKDSATNPASSNPTILMESNFEVNGMPSIEQWKRVDTLKRAVLFFSNDVPPDSIEHCSVGFKSPDTIENIISLSVVPSNQIGSNFRTFTLSYWAKGSSFDMPNILAGLEVISPYSFQFKGGGQYATVWQQYTLTINMDYPAKNINVSIGLFPTTSRDTTEYTLFTGFKLVGK